MVILTTLNLLCGITYLIIGMFTLLNDSRNRLNKLFFIICISLAYWAILFSLMNRSHDADTANTFYVYSALSWSLFHCVLLHFIIVLTGREDLLKKRFAYALFYLPALISIYLYFFQPLSAQDFVKTNLGWVALEPTDRGFIWTNFYNIYYLSYMVAIVYFLFRWWRNSGIIREKKQAKLILITILISGVGAGITDIILPLFDILVMPSIGVILVIIPIIGTWYSIKKYKLMDINPDHFALEVLKIMSEGLIIVNHQGIIKDISEIKQAQKKLMKSSDELELKVKERTSELSKANKELEHEIVKRIEMQEDIKILAYHDHLTGLPNKRLFSDRLNRSILIAAKQGKSLGILFIDLDSFKRINDTMGHAKGDELLRMVSIRLTNSIREIDTVCRVAGDEFLILIHNLESEHYIREVSGRILNILKLPFTIDNSDLYITTSIGGAIYPSDGHDVETLIKNADIAMYSAKEKGKNKFELCTSFLKDSLVKEMKITNSLYQALERDELELYYQPQLNIISGEIIGLEALVRWNHPELGIVSPGDFISIAEKTGLILPIGEWVLRTACIQNKKWQDEGILNVPIAVNLSVNQFQNTQIVEMITKILEETKLNPNDLELEITENIIMKETEYIIESLKKLKQLGVTVAIDDFGTEYSSLNYIKQLPVDKIKIAMSFIWGININDKDEAIINVIIVLAKNLGLKVIAEGVETREQLDFLRDQMCDEVQGYYYYKPMPAKQIEALISR